MAATRKRHETGEFKAHVKKGDLVLVLSGRSRGHKGRVAQVLPRHERAIVEGGNLVTRHQRPRPRPGQQRATAKQESGRIEKPAPIHVSKLMVICPHCNRQTRVGHREVEGRSVRVCRHEGCADVIDRQR